MAAGDGGVQNEQEDSKCREFVAELNRLAEHERYRYIGHLSELEPKYFSEFLIKDRRTSKELHIECARFAPDWMTVERANLQILERRFAQDLPHLGYENYEIYLEMRDPHTHPLQKLNRTGVDEVARYIKQFLAVRRPEVGEQGFVKFNLGDFVRYAPLARIFYVLRLSKIDVASQDEGGAPAIRAGVIGFEPRELEQRLEQTITSKLREQDHTADILLVYSEGPLFLLDVPQTVTRLTEIALAHNAQQGFSEIWFLAHYWTADQKLHRVV